MNKYYVISQPWDVRKEYNSLEELEKDYVLRENADMIMSAELDIIRVNEQGHVWLYDPNQNDWVTFTEYKEGLDGT